MPKYFEKWATETLTKHTDTHWQLMQDGVNASLPSDAIGNHPCFSEMADKVIYPGCQRLKACQITPKEMLTGWQTACRNLRFLPNLR